MSAVKTRVVFDKHALPPLYKQVGIYARVSTRSAEQMESLAIQVSELVSRFRNQYQMRIYDVYIDVLSGAHTENRPSYQRMMNDCRNKKLDLIVCKSISRFGRNTEEMLRTIHELRDLGINVYFDVENINTSDSSTEFILSVIAGLREAENKSHSENVRIGLRNRALEGTSKNYSRPCFGYQKNADGQLEINDSEARTVRIIYDAYLQGASINQIHDLLLQRRIPSPSGKESWCKRTIDEILSNEKYVGDVLLMKRIRLSVGSKRIKNHGEQEQYRIEGNHPPIITREAFDAVQQEKVRRTNIDKSDNTAHRKSTRYKSKFSISMYEFKDWE